MSKIKQCAIIARVPKDLRRKLDDAAKRARRSRSAEMQVRLEDSLRRIAVLPPVEGEVAT